MQILSRKILGNPIGKNISLLKFSKRRVKIMENNFLWFGELSTFLVKSKMFTYQKSIGIQIYRIICNKAAALIALITVDL